MSYAVYAKRLEGYYDVQTRKQLEPDATYRPLSNRGCRVNRLADAKIFETKEAAESWLGTKATYPKVSFEIRKVK